MVSSHIRANSQFHLFIFSGTFSWRRSVLWNLRPASCHILYVYHLVETPLNSYSFLGNLLLLPLSWEKDAVVKRTWSQRGPENKLIKLTWFKRSTEPVVSWHVASVCVVLLPLFYWLGGLHVKVGACESFLPSFSLEWLNIRFVLSKSSFEIPFSSTILVN